VSDAAGREAFALFDLLIELPPEVRAARLAALAAEQPALAAAVARLLRRDEEAEGVLDRGVLAAAPTLISELGEGTQPSARLQRAGQVIGGFRLIRVIGRGGMGEVWLAERSERGFTQQAALKLLPRGMDSEDLVRRFLRERRILAGLEHPGIARFIDGGLSEDGLPWYAMEYVEGEMLTDYARRRGLDLRARVALVAEICDAVAYAQARLVVHRDIKPSNILVDAVGRARLLDFGIAKLLEDELDPTTTRTGIRAMSPAYAAPEQILDEPVGTATDVYALGVVLYELLTGRLPHRRDGSLQTLSREVSGESAPRPSQALRQGSDTTTLGLDATAMTRMRRAIDADLDSVVLNALRREPERRYPNAAALAEDLRNWLDRRPVRARPDTLGYRMRRFVRRHAVGVAATVAVALALLLGLGVSLHQAAEARRQAARADLEAARAETEAASAIAQATLAREQAERAKRAVGFLTSLFRDDDPYALAARGRMRMDEAFEDALARIDRDFEDDPALRADLLDDFAELLVAKGRLDEAEPRFEQALALAVRAHGDAHPAVAESLDNLGVVALMRGQPEAALPYIERALAIRDQFRDADLAAYANTANSLATVLYYQGDLERTRHWLETSLAAYRESLGEDSPRTDGVRLNLGVLLGTLGRLEEATALLEAVAAGMARRGESESAAMLPLLSQLGELAYARGDAEAERGFLEQRLELARRLYPGDHVWHADALLDRAILGRNLGEDASPWFEAASTMYARLGSPAEATARGQWAVATAVQGRPEAALALLVPVERLCAQAEAADGFHCLSARISQSRVLVAAGRPRQALDVISQLAAALDRLSAEPTRHHADALEARAAALLALGQTQEAAEDLRRAQDIFLSIYGEHHRATRRVAAQRAALPERQSPP
jgi:serine/threonine-protein kinase